VRSRDPISDKQALDLSSRRPQLGFAEKPKMGIFSDRPGHRGLNYAICVDITRQRSERSGCQQLNRMVASGQYDERVLRHQSRG
jgi:hypothetical protein